MYRILIEKKAARLFSKQDAKRYRIISTAIKRLTSLHDAKNLDIKPLKGKFKNMMRLRIGSRRVLFTVDERKKTIKIWVIEDRGDVY